MKFYTHPLRDGIRLILEKHFAPEIVNRFKLVFEAEKFQGEAIHNQLKNERLVLEVYYEDTDGTNFICDVWSTMTPPQAEAHLLRCITDAARVGKIGKTWTADDAGRISEDVTSGKFETKEEVITE